MFAELPLWRATASRAVLKPDCTVETTFIFPPSEPPDELPALLCVFIFLYILFFFPPQNKLQLELTASDQTAHEKGCDRRFSLETPVCVTGILYKSFVFFILKTN